MMRTIFTGIIFCIVGLGSLWFFAPDGQIVATWLGYRITLPIPLFFLLSLLCFLFFYALLRFFVLLSKGTTALRNFFNRHKEQKTLHLLTQAIEAFILKEPQKGQQLLQKIGQASPTLAPMVTLFKGHYALENNHPEEARAILEQAYFPKTTAALQLQAYIKEERLHAHVHDIKRLLKLYPHDMYFQYGAFLAALEEQDWEFAEYLLKKLKKAEDLPAPYAKLSNLYYKAKAQTPYSLTQKYDWEKAWKEDPEDAESFLQWMHCLSDKEEKNIERALQSVWQHTQNPAYLSLIFSLKQADLDRVALCKKLWKHHASDLCTQVYLLTCYKAGLHGEVSALWHSLPGNQQYVLQVIFLLLPPSEKNKEVFSYLYHQTRSAGIEALSHLKEQQELCATLPFLAECTLHLWGKDILKQP